ncbi:hypothetical protein K461DRAFT_268877 [Myriangium duriaei CBS 260.36]|uniref:Yeast cell wall synthesis Kre9/Knh1-like N-terminal domain-containing protein n=1 Tax=Myriangium duriaei CBS 260.36 TaxID=1168546 RepID=A0A9P4IZV1_9PEZI|nr:hypothetical protein K461DRAFT_268877 [Myriangium duriaei CBS 260.36]
MSTSDFSTFALFTAGLAAFAPAVSALVVPGGSNPTAGAVTAPDSTSSVTAGQSFKVQWNSSDSAVCGDKVDLVLLYGPSPAQMNAQDYIVQGIANSGSYDWTPSTGLKASDDTNKYGIELICQSTKAYQYTTRFQIANKNPTSSSASASSPAGGYTSSTGSSSGSHSATSSATASSSSAASSDEPKYPTGNSTTAAGTTGAATTSTATSSGHHSSSTGSSSGSKTSGSGASSTGSSTSSSASAASSGNAADHLKAGFGGLLAAAAVAALAFLNDNGAIASSEKISAPGGTRVESRDVQGAAEQHGSHQKRLPQDGDSHVLSGAPPQASGRVDSSKSDAVERDGSHKEGTGVLQGIEDYADLAPDTAVGGVDSTMSSPLSSPGEDFDFSSPPPFSLSASRVEQVPDTISLSASDTFHGGHSAMAAPIRTFRTRTAIQMHPYILEKEKHNRMFRAAGYKPVHLVGSQLLGDSQTGQPLGEQGHQNITESSQASFSSSQATPSQSQAIDTATTILMPDDEDADLPDVETLMRQSKPGRLPKRRKLFRPTTFTPARAYHGAFLDLPTGGSQPPTPPTSHSEASSAAQDDDGKQQGFRLPRLYPRGILTPKTSSPMRGSSSRRKVAYEVLPEDNQEEHDQISVSSASESKSESPSGSETEVQFQSARKRIKGVLPASWLRFDSKANKSTKEDKRSGLNGRSESGINTLAKGVAQRRTVAKASSQTHGNHFEGFSSGSDDERPPPTPVRRPQATENSSLALSLLDAGFGSDEMEDNNVDAMLPTASRRRKDSRKSSKKKSTLSNALIHPTSTSNATARQHSTASSHRSRSEKARRRHYREQAKLRQPRLSVLDLEQTIGAKEGPAPPFLRLAKRQARKQQNYGRHSPSRKAIRLATRADTEDAMSTLTAWRSGTIAQRDLVANASRAKNPPQKDSKRPHMSLGGNITTENRIALLQSLARRANTSTQRTGQQPRIDTHFGLSRVSENANRQQQDFRKPEHQEEQSSRAKATRRFMLQSSTRAREVFRPAQLEADDHRPRFDRAPGTTSLHARNLTTGHDQRAPQLNFQLQRFLDERHEQSADHSSVHEDYRNSKVSTAHRKPLQIVRRKTKAAPRRLSVEISDFRQPIFPLPVVTIHDDPQDNPTSVPAEGLQGLDAFNGQFPTDFDIRPLEIGTFFHSSTFLGSGDFANVLDLKRRNLDEPAGHITIRIDDQDTRWSAWCEETATLMGTIRNICEDAFQFMISAEDEDVGQLEGPMGTTTYLLRSLVRYVSSCLQFSDPVDRSAFLLRLQRFLEDMVDIITSSLQQANAGSRLEVKKHLDDCGIYVACLAFQHITVSGSESFAAPARELAIKMLKQMSFMVAQDLFKESCESLRAFAEGLRHHSIRDAGLKDDAVAAKLVVVLNHMFTELNLPGLSLDNFTAELWRGRIADSVDVWQLDMIWYDVLSIQPLLNLDTSGIYRPNGPWACSCWTVTKILFERTFALYNATLDNNNASAAAYLRTLFSRVSLLLTKWKWRAPDPALAIIYDFFAQRGLAHLPKERSAGSPAFLRGLNGEPTLEIETSDPGYHAFLKTLASGLKSVSRDYPESKLKRIAWRFVPNHGRTYRKDQDVRKADLEALRNHHDLLCTLYWALPAGSRPRLDHIKDLVEFSTSHQEACRINIDAWRNLAVYIMSHEDQQHEVGPLAEWFGDFSIAVINQYRLARSEAEELFEMSKDKQSGAISFDVMQMTVTGNQRRIMDTLHVALLAVQDALNACSVKRRKLDLAEQCNLVAVFKIFDAAQPRTFAPVRQILNVVKNCLTSVESTQAAAQSEESQDYGNWEGLDDLVESQKVEKSYSDEVGMFQPAVNQLLSNCFGADDLVDDSLLVALVEVWCILAARTVERGNRSWSQYLDSHGGDSWFQLRHTIQFSKFTPFMLAQVLIADRSAFFDHEDVFLTQWLVALVDREAMLKFQHDLTSTMLNIETQCSLLHDLPFAVDPGTYRFNITLSELRSRRAALVGSVLSNMRATLDSARSNTPDLKREYTSIMRQMMQAMKESYQSLTKTDSHSTTADPSAKGAHVSFLQQVISLMQQYTSDFCAVDSFFTDSTVFPLPSNDPKYIIARLKSYAPKVQADSGRKQLIILLQTLASNAASTATQPALASQLVAALLPTVGDAGQHDRALRKTLLAEILPAYCSLVPNTRGAALLATPLVEAACTVIAELRFHVRLAALATCRQEMQLVDVAIQGLVWAVEKLMHLRSDALSTEQLAFLAAVFDAAAKTLTTLDYASRACGLEFESLWNGSDDGGHGHGVPPQTAQV